MTAPHFGLTEDEFATLECYSVVHLARTRGHPSELEARTRAARGVEQLTPRQWRTGLRPIRCAWISTMSIDRDGLSYEERLGFNHRIVERPMMPDTMRPHVDIAAFNLGARIGFESQ